jgi:hypothetical protein
VKEVVFCFYSTQSLNPCSSGGSYCYYSPLSFSLSLIHTHILGRWLLKLLLSTPSGLWEYRSMSTLARSRSISTLSCSFHPTCDIPFPPRRTGIYWKGMISARPVVPEGEEICLGSRTLERAEARPTGHAVSKERLGDWDGQMDV